MTKTPLAAHPSQCAGKPPCHHQSRTIRTRSGAAVLPAPCPQRRHGSCRGVGGPGGAGRRQRGCNLTEAMAAATPGSCLRIGLGHGAISDFSGEKGAPGIIPPDRAPPLVVDYLALDGWRGQMQVNTATWYAGSPKADGFYDDPRGRIDP